MNNSPLMIFDIETMPDVATGKRLHSELATLSDDDALTALIAMRQAESGSDFMRLPLHKVVCLSFVWVENGNVSLHSKALNQHSEKEILEIFLRGLHNKKPTLISWNGAGFDLPVLLYRMAHHGLNASPLVNAGFQKYDYLNRYSEKHIDLIDKFSFGLWGNKQKLDIIASLLGFAGKQDIDGSQVVPMVLANEWQKLTAYCESDVLNTWLIYLKWLLLYGKISPDEVAFFNQQTQEMLTKHQDSTGNLIHQGFLDAWDFAQNLDTLAD